MVGATGGVPGKSKFRVGVLGPNGSGDITHNIRVTMVTSVIMIIMYYIIVG